MKRIFTTTIAALFYLAINHSQASAGEAMELQMFVEEEIEIADEKGNRETKLIAAESIVPGDVVVYTTRYLNKGGEQADDVVITNPIPAEVSYIDGSAEREGSVTTFSTDGGKHYDSPRKLIFTDAYGNYRKAIGKDYTHIRWSINSIDPNGKGYVSYKAKLK